MSCARRSLSGSVITVGTFAVIFVTAAIWCGSTPAWRPMYFSTGSLEIRFPSSTARRPSVSRSSTWARESPTFAWGRSTVTCVEAPATTSERALICGGIRLIELTLRIAATNAASTQNPILSASGRRRGSRLGSLSG